MQVVTENRIKESEKQLASMRRQLADMEHSVSKMRDFEKQLASMRRQLADMEHSVSKMKDKTPQVEATIECLEQMGIERGVLFGYSRKRGRLFFARCVFSERLRRYGYTFAEIAGILHRDHATVVHYVKSYEQAVREPRFEKDFIGFINEFNEKSNNE